MDSDTLFHSLLVKQGLPKSHQWINTIIGNKTVPGILWNDNDIVSKKINYYSILTGRRFILRLPGMKLRRYRR